MELIFIKGDEDKYGSALHMELLAGYQLWCGKEVNYKKKLFSELELNGILVTDSDRFQSQIRTEARIAGSINYSVPEICKMGEQVGEFVCEEGYDYGRFNLGLNIGHETDQEFNNQNYTVGAELTYVYTKENKLEALKPLVHLVHLVHLIPSFSAAYEQVSSYKSDILNNNGVEDDDYQRFRIEGSYKVDLGKYLPELFKPLRLHLDARYFKGFGRSNIVNAKDLDESKYFAGALSYNLNESICYGMLSGVYLKVSDGRIPPIEENETQVYFGIKARG